MYFPITSTLLFALVHFICDFSVLFLCLCFYLIAYPLPPVIEPFFHIYLHVSVFCIFFPFIPVCSSTPSLPFLFLLPSLIFFGLPQFVQRRSQFDSVSLVIQGSMEGELNLMDNLSGSICHYYSLPPRPSKRSTDKKVKNRQNDDSLPPFHV